MIHFNRFAISIAPLFLFNCCVFAQQHSELRPDAADKAQVTEMITALEQVK